MERKDLNSKEIDMTLANIANTHSQEFYEAAKKNSLEKENIRVAGSLYVSNTSNGIKRASLGIAGALLVIGLGFAASKLASNHVDMATYAGVLKQTSSFEESGLTLVEQQEFLKNQATSSETEQTIQMIKEERQALRESGAYDSAGELIGQEPNYSKAVLEGLTHTTPLEQTAYQNVADSQLEEYQAEQGMNK